MTRNRKVFTLVLINLLLLVLAACGTKPTENSAFQAKNGTLDLQAWEATEGELLPLTGEWAFYWAQLLSPAEVGETPTTNYVPVPDNWQDYMIEGENLPAEGYATFHLQLKNLKPDQVYGLYLDSQSTAFNVWQDGILLAQHGQVGTSKDKMVPYKNPEVIFLQTNDGNADLVLQISNYFHQKAGFRDALLLGLPNTVLQHQMWMFFVETFLIAVLIVMGLYHIFLFAFRPQNKAPLYFALLCWLTAVRMAVTSQRIILDIFPKLSWTLLFRIEYLTFFLLIPLFALFLRSLYPRDVPRWFIRLIWIVGVGFSLLLLWPNTLQLSRLSTPYQAIVLAELVALAYLIIRVVFRKREDAWLIALACVIGIIAITIDIFYYNGYIPISGELAPFGFLAFVFVQAIMLSHRFSKAFHDVEDLSVTLEHQNILLAQSEKKYRAIFEESNDIILVAALNGQIIDINPACEAILGYPREEALQLNTADAYASQQDLNYVRQTVLAQGMLKDYELNLLKKDGQEIDALISSRVRYHKDGSILGVQSVVRDITDRKRAEQERLKNLELDAFAHTVAHDLKSPLSRIITGLDLLQLRTQQMLDTDSQKILQISLSGGLQMAQIIDELLLLARVRQEDIVTEPLPMQTIVLSAIQRVQHMIDEAHAEVILPDEWETAVGYAPWVEEVWANYLSNGLKYGGHPPRLELGCKRLDNDRVRYWIRDNGQGLTKEDQSKLFQSFTRLNPQAAQGHGLGLSIVDRIINRLGGEVGVESIVGQGSTFYFTLPAVTL